MKRIKNEQLIHINLDDSGKISEKEEIAVYGGFIFFSKNERDKFITQYKSIINDIKCKYCKLSKENCNNNCPELKHYNLKNKDIRRIINYTKKYTVVACIIKNKKIYKNIINDKASKGRYADYALRRMIKEVLKSLINEKKLSNDKPINIILNIDEQPTKSNGYYNLKDGLFEELKYGIINFNYGRKYKPIINSKLKINLSYQKSDKSYTVQAADLVAGTVRKMSIKFYGKPNELNKRLAFVNYKIFYPKRKKPYGFPQLGWCTHSTLKRLFKHQLST